MPPRPIINMENPSIKQIANTKSLTKFSEFQDNLVSIATLELDAQIAAMIDVVRA